MSNERTQRVNPFDPPRKRVTLKAIEQVQHDDRFKDKQMAPPTRWEQAADAQVAREIAKLKGRNQPTMTEELEPFEPY